VITSVAWSEDHGWVGAGARERGRPTRLLGLKPPNRHHPIASWEGGDVLEIVTVPREGEPDALVVTQANPGQVTRLSAADDGQAQVLSAPLDARLPVRWGRLHWRGPAGGGEPRFAVRAGNSPTPDPAWSDWIDLGRGRDLELDRVPARRALQWRATLPRGSRLDAVSVSALAPNLAPQIAHFRLEPDGTLFRGNGMGGGETVTEQLAGGLQVEYTVTSRRDRRLDRERAATLRPVRALTWHTRDPNEDRLEHRAFFRAEGEDVWRPLGEATVEQIVPWDTARLDDGWYELRLVVRDHLSNPDGLALSAEQVIGPVPVDNTPPRLEDWSLEATPDGFAVELTATDAFGPLAGAQLVLPDGRTERLDPRDGICDAAQERFAAQVRFPRPWGVAVARPWTVRVEVWDLQGNLATVDGIVR
jgi:hypothetical protein